MADRLTLTELISDWLVLMNLEDWRVDLILDREGVILYKSYPYMSIRGSWIRVYNQTFYFDYGSALNVIRDPRKEAHIDLKAADPEFFNKLYVECRRRMKIEWKLDGGPSREVLAERWLTFNPELDD